MFSQWKALGLKFFANIRAYLIFATVLFMGSFSAVQAAYPPIPTQFDGGGGIIIVATDENNHAIAAYTNSRTGGGAINTYYFENNVWTLIPLTASGSVSDLRMAPSGLALLTYRDFVSNDLLSFYFNGTAWVAPSNNPIDTTISTGGQLAINNLGLGVTVWSDAANDIRVSFFSGNDWGAPSASGAIGTGNSTKIAINASGDLIVGWEDLTGAVVVNHYIGGVWTGPVAVDPSAFIARGHAVGIADNGKSLVMFEDSPTSDVYASYFISGVFNSTTMLNPPQPFGPANFELNLEMAQNATAVATWVYDQTFFNQFDAYYAQFDGNTWASAVDFQTGISTIGPAVSLNSNGDALFLWGNRNDPNPVTFLAATLPVGGTLGSPEIVQTGAPLVTQGGSPSASLADNGFSALAWGQSTALSDDLTPFGLAAIVDLTPFPPTGLTGSTCKNRFATQTERVNIITFQPSVTVGVVSYNLFRDGVLIANILATGPFIYEDHNRCRGASVYTLTAVDADGLSSTPVSITIL